MAEAMTAEQARTFNGISLGNAALVYAAAQARGCDCEPYRDWFTYDRWLAQGFQVKKGEHASAHVPCFTRDILDEDGNVIKKGRPWTSHLFCRCQTKLIEGGDRVDA